uniref:ribonuclease III family protein n=1 Tax=Eubacterium cellulosolvens TaxID=29322 RepID=UPI00047F4394|nr:ribonuclease III domain-containing protein [[Eubacterium] cellulosolvens]
MSQNEWMKTVVQKQIGYEFQNPLLLRQAFVRKSYTEENGGENNEVLEFIGDTVLSTAVMRYLTEKYGNAPSFKRPIWPNTPQKPMDFHCEKTEGELSRLKQKLTEKKTLARRIDELGFAKFLIMGKGDIGQNMAKQASVKEDLFEAILGAVALDSSFDYEKIQSVVEIMLLPDSIVNDGEEADYVQLIYEWDDAIGAIPYFRYRREPYGISFSPHDPEVIVVFPEHRSSFSDLCYTCEMSIRNDLPRFKAYGSSKTDARQNVCEAAYKYLAEHDELLSIRDEIEEPSPAMAINQLEILARRGYFALPKYSYNESHDKNGNPIWRVKCRIDELDLTFDAKSSSKKQAKKKAAYKMLTYALKHYEDA